MGLLCVQVFRQETGSSRYSVLLLLCLKTASINFFLSQANSEAVECPLLVNQYSSSSKVFEKPNVMSSCKVEPTIRGFELLCF